MYTYDPLSFAEDLTVISISILASRRQKTTTEVQKVIVRGSQDIDLFFQYKAAWAPLPEED